MDGPSPPAGSEPWRFSREGERLPDHCLDCGAPLAGFYCAACGQKNELEHRSLWQLVKDAVGPAVLLESKLTVLKGIPLTLLYVVLVSTASLGTLFATLLLD